MDDLSVVVDLFPFQPFANSTAANAKLQEYKAHIRSGNRDLAEEERTAHEYEHEVNHAEGQAARYDLGEAASSDRRRPLLHHALLTRRRSYFFSVSSLGTVGILIAVSAIFVH